MSEPEIRRRLQVAAGAGGIAVPASSLVAEFVALFRAQPAVIAQLLADHADDGTGRCRVCANGPQAGRQVWPCRLRDLAEQASRPATGGPR
jgi:hypothetical protein